ncbi:MAG: polymer-forming cytoskeletal protein [Alphaproteobacteria bacterium]|nr:polymer-forming cytoskeletal protein [Alphaproteobacteria bacterium]
MFSKAKSKQGGEEKVKASMAEAPMAAATAAPAKRSSAMKSAGVPSIISADVRMLGNIDSAGEVQLDGELEGDIRAGVLIVGEKAIVRGEIVCDNVTVRGRVEGGIRAKNVTLAATAHIEGDILHSSLAVESGAHFEGNCRHSDDPLSEASTNDFRKARPSGPAPKPASAREAPGAVDQTASDSSLSRTAPQPAAVGANDAPSFLSPNRNSPLR